MCSSHYCQIRRRRLCLRFSSLIQRESRRTLPVVGILHHFGESKSLHPRNGKSQIPVLRRSTLVETEMRCKQIVLISSSRSAVTVKNLSLMSPQRYWLVQVICSWTLWTLNVDVVSDRKLVLSHDEPGNRHIRRIRNLYHQLAHNGLRGILTNASQFEAPSEDINVWWGKET